MAWTAETLLTTIGQHGLVECITEVRLVELTGLSEKQVENACQRLRRHGFISRSGRGCFALTAAGQTAIAEGGKLRAGPRGPQESGQRRRDPGMRQRIWNTLRTGRKLTIDDILMRVSDGDERDGRGNVGKYLRALAKGGYTQPMAIREVPLCPTSNGSIRWWLISDTGPKAPVVRVTRKTIYDPNLDAEITMSRGGE